MEQIYYARPMFNTKMYELKSGEYYLIEKGIVVQFVKYNRQDQYVTYKMKDTTEKKEWQGNVNFYRKIKGPADLQEKEVYILRKGSYKDKEVEKNGQQYKLLKKEVKEVKSYEELQKQQISEITILMYTLEFQNINNEKDVITISQGSNDTMRDYIEVPMSFTNTAGGKRKSKKTRKARKTRKGTYRRRR